jgi:hypothetical protein
MLLLFKESCLAFKNDKTRALGHMVEDERSGSLRYVTTIAFVILALALVGCGTLTLLPHQNDASLSKLLTCRDLAVAYARIQPGVTPASHLVRFGFDSTSANAQVLSYLGVMEYFMPRDSVKFDRLDAAVRDCIDARDRCAAMVFRSSDRSAAAPVDGFFSTIGFGATAAVQPPQVTLLIRDGRVVFKAMSGIPAAVERVHGVAASPTNGTVRVTHVSFRSGY